MSSKHQVFPLLLVMSRYSLSLRALSYSLLTLFLCWERAIALLVPISLILVYMTLLTILISLPFVERKAILLLVEGARVICVLFFLSASSFLSWLSFELSSLPIFFLILLWGKQKEKNQALLLYLVYSAVAARVFLFSFLFLDGAPRRTSSFLIVLPFLIKLPCFFLHL